VGDLRLQAAGYEISFANEDVGWYVSFEGDVAKVDIDELVAQVARQVQGFHGAATKWIRIT
jgi:hypothetical protein